MKTHQKPATTKWLQGGLHFAGDVAEQKDQM
jgi:hypothetical protein